jgi:hypothetical protein
MSYNLDFYLPVNHYHNELPKTLYWKEKKKLKKAIKNKCVCVFQVTLGFVFQNINHMCVITH